MAAAQCRHRTCSNRLGVGGADFVDERQLRAEAEQGQGDVNRNDTAAQLVSETRPRNTPGSDYRSE